MSIDRRVGNSKQVTSNIMDKVTEMKLVMKTVLRTPQVKNILGR